MMDKKTDEFYQRLQEELDRTTEVWPAPYLYKFIVPSDAVKVEEVKKAFDNTGAVINTHHSKTGKFTSLSISLIVPDSTTVIGYYKAVSHIEGILSL